MTFPQDLLDIPGIRFCLLAYKSREFQLQSHEDRSVVLLIEGRDGIHILVDPEWKSAVSVSDRDFIGELLSDFAQRAKSDPVNLIEQTRFLSVGPLITCAEGSLPSSNPSFADAIQRFVQIGTT